MQSVSCDMVHSIQEISHHNGKKSKYFINKPNFPKQTRERSYFL